MNTTYLKDSIYLLVAKKFGKSHKNVIASIKDILTSAENSANLFTEATYQDSYGRDQFMYIMNRDGFTLLAMYAMTKS